MSIATKTGDQGMTGLLFNRRVPKSHPRVEACGAVDELNAALGLARASATDPFVKENLLRIQRDLVTLMGELAVVPQDMLRFIREGFTPVGPEMTARVDALVKEIEAHEITYRDWAMPGGTFHSAALDMARTICRRAERRICSLQEAGEMKNPEIIIFLNRLSDLLWLLARWVEQEKPPGSAELSHPSAS